MTRRASMILAVMALALLWAEPGQAGAPAARPPAGETAPSQMEKFLQQQIAQERQKQRQKQGQKQRQKHATKNRLSTKRPPPQKSQITPVKKPQAKKQRVKKPFYRVLLIAGWRKRLRADLITPDQEVIRVKAGDRLNAHLGAGSPRSFIVKAITAKNVRLARGGRTFLLRMASEKDMRRRARARAGARAPVSVAR